MKNNYLIVFLLLVILGLGYFVLKNSNKATSEEQNQTSAAATAKLQTYSNATTVQPIQKATTIDQPPINYTFTKTLASGMKSDEVTKLQQVLAENVYYEGEMTGAMDKLTVQELKDFQTDNGLEATGTTGPKTRALLSELSRHLGPCAGGQQAIRVRRPNGGETYTVGGQMNVRWRTCNATINDQVMIILKSTQSTSGAEITTVPNTRTATVTVPSTLGVGIPIISGQYYKIRLELGGNAMGHIAPSDESNNLFTINTTLALPVTISGEFPTSGTFIISSLYSGVQIARFKITNNSTARITLNNVRLTDNGTHSGTSSTYWLYASDENMTNYTANQIGGRLNSFDFTPLASYPIIHPGSYRYITVTINNTSGIQTGDLFSLGVRTNGDVNYFVSEQDLGYDANGDGDMNDIVYNLPTIGNPQLGTIQIN